MRAIYEDNGSGKLTGAKLVELGQQLPPDAEVLSFKVEESQTDGWYWSIKARVPEVPRVKPYTLHPRGSVADQVGGSRG